MFANHISIVLNSINAITTIVHAKRANAEYKIRGRLAHPGHISRDGQAWKADSVQVFTEDHQGGHRIFDMPRGSKACEKCGDIIRYDHRGLAFCDCKIWNESTTKASLLNHAYKVRAMKRFARSMV